MIVPVWDLPAEKKFWNSKRFQIQMEKPKEDLQTLGRVTLKFYNFRSIFYWHIFISNEEGGRARWVTSVKLCPNHLFDRERRRRLLTFSTTLGHAPSFWVLARFCTSLTKVNWDRTAHIILLWITCHEIAWILFLAFLCVQNLHLVHFSFYRIGSSRSRQNFLCNVPFWN